MVKEEYEGRRFTKGELPFYGILGEVSLGFAGVEFCSGKGLVQGHQFAGGFGHGGQDIHMISWS